MYEKANHLGNVLVTLSDRKFPMKITELDYYWNFENSDDSEVNGSGLDPVTNTATYVSSAGYDGSDVIETNTGDYVEFADDARLDFGTRDFTVAVWVKKITQLNYGNAVVSKWNTGASPGTNEWILNLNGGISGTTNGPAFGVQIGTTSYSAKKATPVTNTGQWYFLVGKREGNTISIYVDGVLEDTETIPTGASINNISGRKMSIGKIDAGYYSNMQVDNLMIFDNALSDSQIVSMYAGEQYAYYEPNVLSYSDYYPFGSLLPGRNGNNGDYRYGFNGMEQDEEVKNNPGNSYTTHFRSYDPRLGRWLSMEPKIVAWESPYASFRNNPILFNDPLGDCPDGDCDDVQSMKGGSISIPKGSAKHMYGDKVYSFSSQGQDFWWDSKANAYTSLGSELRYTPDAKIPSHILSANSARFEKAAYNFAIEQYENGVVPTITNYSWSLESGETGTGIMVMGKETKQFEAKDYPEVGVGESMIPIWGSGKQAYYNFSDGDYIGGAGYTILAISDVFLVKSIVTGSLKGGITAMGKNYKNWGGGGGWRSFYGKTGFAESGQQLHHWAWRRGGQKSGSTFGWKLKNQMWNLMPMQSQARHTAVHGWGKNAYGPFGKFWYGTPTWFKAGGVSVGGRFLNDD